MAHETRTLTDGETAGLHSVFGKALDYGAIRIHRGPEFNPLAIIAFANGNPAIALGRHIHIRSDHYRADYAGEPQAFAAFIAHEATHVWQWRCGRFNPIRYLWQYWTWPRHGYDISGVTAESRFEALGYDQQAEVVRAYVLARGRGEAGRPWSVVLAQQLAVNSGPGGV